MNREQLFKKLNLMKSCLSSQEIVPILKHFCFDSGRVTAFNGFQVACLKLDTDLSCGLPGDLLLKLLNSYSSENISLDQKELEVLLKSGISKTKLALLPKEDFVFAEPATIKGYERTLDEDFITGLERCLISINDNPQMKNQTGVTLVQDANYLSIYSTDGTCISSYLIKSPYDSFVTMLPKLFCEQVVTWFREFGKGEILFAKDCVRVDFEEGFLYSQLDPEVEFLDFKSELAKILPSRISYVEVPANLVNILDRSLLLTSSEIDQFVDVTISEGFMDIVTTSAHGTIRDSTDLGDVVKKDTQFRMDCKLLKRAVESVKEMTFIQTNNSIIFVGADDKFTHLVNSVAK